MKEITPVSTSKLIKLFKLQERMLCEWMFLAKISSLTFHNIAHDSFDQMYWMHQIYKTDQAQYEVRNRVLHQFKLLRKSIFCSVSRGVLRSLSNIEDGPVCENS